MMYNWVVQWVWTAHSCGRACLDYLYCSLRTGLSLAVCTGNCNCIFGRNACYTLCMRSKVAIIGNWYYYIGRVMENISLAVCALVRLWQYILGIVAVYLVVMHAIRSVWDAKLQHTGELNATYKGPILTHSTSLTYTGDCGFFTC